MRLCMIEQRPVVMWLTRLELMGWRFWQRSMEFSMAGPTSTIDLSTPRDVNKIEEREPEEVTEGLVMHSSRGEGIQPGFDITPHRYITAIITEKGIIRGL